MDEYVPMQIPNVAQRHRADAAPPMIPDNTQTKIRGCDDSAGQRLADGIIDRALEIAQSRGGSFHGIRSNTTMVSFTE